MAAHLKTALEQVTQDIELNRINWNHLQAALDISCWTEDLRLDDYVQLQGIVTDQDLQRLKEWVFYNLIKAEIEWGELGQPATREQWILTKYARR